MTIKEMTEIVLEDHMIFDALNADGLELEKKIALCTMQSNATAFYKKLDGSAGRRPFYCHKCPKCLEMQAQNHEIKFNAANRRAIENKPNGHWRMQIVPKNSRESTALKKRINRNQDARHMAIDSLDSPGMEEIWSFVSDEPRKNMNSYGDIADPTKIDWHKINMQNKQTGNKISYGKGIRGPSKPTPEKDTVRVLMPEIIISSPDDKKKALEIIGSTNLLEYATDHKNAQHLILLQFQYILQELEKEDIKNNVVRDSYFNLPEKELLNLWNGNVENCMSLYTAINNNQAADWDTIKTVSRFYQSQKEEKLAA